MAQSNIAEAPGQSLTREQQTFVAALRGCLDAGDSIGAAALLHDAARRGGRDATLYHIAAADLLAGRPEQRQQRPCGPSRLAHLQPPRKTHTGVGAASRDRSCVLNAELL